MYMAEYICPHCKKPVYDDDALLCLYCGEGLGRSTGFMAQLKYPTPRVIFTIIVFSVIAGFILLIVIK